MLGFLWIPQWGNILWHKWWHSSQNHNHNRGISLVIPGELVADSNVVIVKAHHFIIWQYGDLGFSFVWTRHATTVYPKKYAHGFCFAGTCCGKTLTDFPISIRLTSLALWQSNDCPSASKATLMNMDKHLMWFHYERLHNHNKAKHNKTVCIFLGIYCRKGLIIPLCFDAGSELWCDDWFCRRPGPFILRIIASTPGLCFFY